MDDFLRENSNSVSGISVIIACYNQAHFIRNCLESLFVSKYPNFEIIFVNDNSSDDTEKIAREYPVTLISLSKNYGNGGARHIGAKAAKKEILLFIDCDTEMPLDVFVRIDRQIRIEGYDGVIGVVDKHSLAKSAAGSWVGLETYYLGMNSPDDLVHHFFIGLCGAIKASVYFDYGGMYHRILDDMEFSSRLDENIRIKTDKGLNFKHFYGGFIETFRKFYFRSFHFSQLEQRPVSPWFLTNRIYATIAAFGAMVSIPLLFFDRRFILIPILALLFHLLLSAPFHCWVFKEAGFLSLFQSIFYRFIFSLAISCGASIGMLIKTFKKLKFKLICLSGPARIFLRKSSPTYAILYVTSACNSNCRFCFQWELINDRNRKKNELTLLEYIRLAQNMGPMEHITLGGGEPFLRKDLSDIAIAFYKYTHVRNISIPSNGIRPDLIELHVENILKNCPDLILKISLSIDGIGDAHDRMRGVAGNYQRVIASDQILRRLRLKYSNLYYIINTCFNGLNHKDVLSTILALRKRFDHDIQVVTYVRGTIAEEEDKKTDINEYFDIVDYLQYIQPVKRKTVSYSLELLHNAIQIETRRAVTHILTKHEGEYSCTAGKNMVVIDDVGNVNPCEILPGRYCFGNLRDFNFDVRKLLSQKRVQNICKEIKKKKCFCTWECALINSIAFSHRGYFRMFKHMFYLYKRRKSKKLDFGKDELMDFESFKKLHPREYINELSGEHCHPMAKNNDNANPFNIRVLVDCDGESISVPAMDTETRVKKKAAWLRPVRQSEQNNGT